MIGQTILMGLGVLMLSIISLLAPAGLVIGVRDGDIPFAIFCGFMCLAIIATALATLGI